MVSNNKDYTAYFAPFMTTSGEYNGTTLFSQVSLDIINGGYVTFPTHCSVDYEISKLKNKTDSQII